MRISRIFLISMSLAFAYLGSPYVMGSEGNKHDDNELDSKSPHDSPDKHDEHEDHDENGANEKEESHAHNEAGGDSHEKMEEVKNVGATKGIVSFDERNGFVLSPEASKNFKIEFQAVQGNSPWILTKSALVMTRDDVSVFRSRDGKLLRVDVTVVSKNHNTAKISSKDLRLGDQIVVQGAGFLRVAELDVTSGESGHHH